MWHVHKQLNLFRQTDGVSDQYKQLKAKFEKDKFAQGKLDVIESSVTLTEAYEKFLAKEKFKLANGEFLRLKTQRKSTPDWFSLFGGPANIEQLASHVKLNAVYEGAYRILSGSVHGTAVLNGVLSKNDKGETELSQIRDSTSLHLITMSTFTYSQMGLYTFVSARMPERKIELIQRLQAFDGFLKPLMKKN